uniref:Uncharacterized protein n=1 Tax=viral metagenome TaxID=1070528 RepID=A0A6M3JS24_9ZZZZ
MLGAWQYAVSTIERGMTATSGLDDFRSGGGAIRTSDWYYLAGQARESQATGDIVQGLPFETPIPGSAYTEVDIDYGQKYVTVADLKYVDVATGEIVRRQVTIERDEISTWNDIEDDIEEVGAAYGVVGGAAGVQILRTRFYSARWIEW